MNLYFALRNMMFVSCFSTLLDIDELILNDERNDTIWSFSTLLDIDELIQIKEWMKTHPVLVLCWILMNLYKPLMMLLNNLVLVLC